MSTGLTEKQIKVLHMIEVYYEAEGRMPSLRQLSQQLGVSLRAVQQHIIALKKKGALQEHAPETASFRIVREDDGPFQKSSDVQFLDTLEGIPILGSIAAGTPMSSLDQTQDRLDMSPAFFGAPSKIFALKVAGNSMLGDYIRDGDWAIIEPTSQWRPTDIVAVRVDHDEFTLKRVEWQGDQIGLVSSNAEYPVIWFDANRIEIVGRFVGLIRK